MSFEFRYGGHAKSSENGNKVEYDSHGSGSATYKSVETELARGVTDASSRATQQAISSVSTRKIQIKSDD